MPDLGVLVPAVAAADMSLSQIDHQVLALIRANPDVTTLDGLCAQTSLPRRYVFGSVAHLEDRGHLEKGRIR